MAANNKLREQKETAKGRRMLVDSKTPQTELLDTDDVVVTEKYIQHKNGTMYCTKLFEPSNQLEAKAMLLHSIGLCDQINWIAHKFGVQFAKLGFIVFMFDHKGMGKTDGLFAQIEDFDQDIVDPAIWLFDYAINNYIKPHNIYKHSIDANSNYFLCGDSMGGGNAICIALKLQKQQQSIVKFKGMILSNPMCDLSPEKTPPKAVVWILQNILLPWMPNAKLVDSAFHFISKNEKIQQICNENPIAYTGNLRLTTGNQLLVTTQFIQENAKELNIPMFIGQGADDVTTDADGCKQFIDKCTSINETDKLIKVYPEKGHVIFLDEPQFFNDATQWAMKYVTNDHVNVDEIDIEQTELI